MVQKFNSKLSRQSPAYKILSKFYEKGLSDAEIARIVGVNRSTICRMKKLKSDDPFGKNGIIDYKYHASFKEAAKKLKIKLNIGDFLHG